MIKFLHHFEKSVAMEFQMERTERCERLLIPRNNFLCGVIIKQRKKVKLGTSHKQTPTLFILLHVYSYYYNFLLDLKSCLSIIIIMLVLMGF